MRPMINIITLLLLCCLSAPTWASAANQEQRIVHNIVNIYRHRHKVPGMMVAVIDHDKVHFYRFGIANVRKGTLINKHSLFQIGSVTKVFTGCLLANAIDTGLIKPEQPITKYLPSPIAKAGGAITQVTVKQLATHMSSLPSYPPTTKRLKLRNYTPERVFSFISKWQPKYKVGSHYQYSDLGYGLLGDALSYVSKKPLSSLYQHTLLTPLQMGDTSLVNKQLLKDPKMVTSYNHFNHPTSLWVPTAWMAAGGLVSNADDMVKFVKANLEANKQPSELSKTLKLSQQPQHLIKDGVYQNYGWVSRGEADKRVIWKFGGVAGFHTFVGFAPKQKLGLVILSNKRIEGKFNRMSLLLLKRLLRQKQRVFKD